MGAKQANPLLIDGENGAINWNCCSAMQMVIFSFPEQACEHFCVWEYFLILLSCAGAFLWLLFGLKSSVECIWGCPVSAVWGGTTLIILCCKGASDLWVMGWLKLCCANQISFPAALKSSPLEVFHGFLKKLCCLSEDLGSDGSGKCQIV